MAIAVSPNRMELLRLKKKQVVAERGHKLLKDKLEGLLQDFTEIVRRYQTLRREIDAEINALFKRFIMASASMPAPLYRAALAFPECRARLSMRERMIMNVRVPVFDFSIDGNMISYGIDDTTSDLDDAMGALRETLQRMVELAEIEKTIELVADEIERTRRRVNALEYVLIPQQADTIKYISAKLQELERGNISRLMKIKDLVAM